MVKENKYIKPIIIIMIIFQIIFLPISKSYAIDDIFQSGDEFLQLGKDEGGEDLINQDKLKIEINKVYNIVFAIGVALSVVGGAILGIKFMIGSVEEQAKIKELLIPYVLGCVVVFGAFGIWKIVITLGGNIF